MKTPFNHPVFKIGLIFCALIFMSCEEAKKEEAAEEQEVPMVEAASQEYADLVQNQLDLMSSFDFDAFGESMADDIAWYWPDGTSETRTTLNGKQAIIDWWKNWKETAGIESLSFANNTFLPLTVNEPSNYYKVVGTGVLSYSDMTIGMGGKTTSVRIHAVYMFNDDKKVTHAFLYYDRTGIAELTKVVLSESVE